MATVTSRDLQEIVSKLSSDKTKTREEGIKLLNTWLEGERFTGFVRYIGQKTAMLKPSEIRHSESWPFLITLLTQCVTQTLEISSSKRRLRKLIFAKTLRIVVQRVEDSSLSVSNPFAYLFVSRDEGKLSRKLIKCVNTYLLKDGPNLGCQSLEIHDAVKQFAFRCWTTTHDCDLKDVLVLYATLQLNLTRGAADSSELVEHLLDVVGKELDQNSICSTNLAWSDTTKDDECGNLTSSQCGVVELAALVFYRVVMQKLLACFHTTKAPSAEKRAKKEHAAAYIREGLMDGRWLCTWSDLIKGEVCDRIAAFCCLSRNYGTRISKDLFVYWFDGFCVSFERIMNDATLSHTYDCLLWALRSLHQLSSVLLLLVPRMEASSNENSWLKKEAGTTQRNKFSFKLLICNTGHDCSMIF
ncbi:hypothetical protein RHGRI_004278 [Rhododendron griersonianum]|uniref:Uncharacterized protein n=1 Tax=Rhododendron griersonianum TaxID=479676 RepID=A0AAV6LA16_9ERIC|nr:hypothetical protein RHGRI_004278 [Rhododendron griersonianum]